MKDNDAIGSRSVARQSANNQRSNHPLPELAIYIPSCDAYSDLWRPYFNLLQRHWPDCPYRVYLGSNALVYGDPRVTTLLSDKGLVWADRCADHLSQIPEPNILMWLEDFLLRRSVDSASIAMAYEDFCRLDARVFRLVKRPGPSFLLPGVNYGPIEPGAPYRISTQASFWKKSFLQEILVPGESIWQFEIEGSRRCDTYRNGFYGVRHDLLPYGHHVVERGRWFPWEAWHFGRMNIGCDFSRRATMPVGVTAKWLLRKVAGQMGLGRIKKFVLH